MVKISIGMASRRCSSSAAMSPYKFRSISSLVTGSGRTPNALFSLDRSRRDIGNRLLRALDQPPGIPRRLRIRRIAECRAVGTRGLAPDYAILHRFPDCIAKSLNQLFQHLGVFERFLLVACRNNAEQFHTAEAEFLFLVH